MPTVLAENGPAWTASYINSGGTTRPWGHSDIKVALVKETEEKCAYCEGIILAVSFGDIEHILPKSKFPDAVVDWDNLTLACSRCNQHKGSKYDADLPFINPYVDSIEDHLLFLGAVVYAVSDRGVYTIYELCLNDASRVEARNRTLQSLESLLRRHEEASNGYIKERLAELIEAQATQGEYTAAIKSYISLRKKTP